MEKRAGVELESAEFDTEQEVGVLDLILREAVLAYEAGYVHAELSEYNVFVSEEGVTVFDWPQAVPTDHDNAAALLRRDVENVARYFRRKYPAEAPEVDATRVAKAVADGSFESVRAFVD